MVAARLQRGVFGSPIGTHNIGSVFLRLDDGVFVWEADPTLVGTTVWFKFTSFNRMGLMEQSLANATAYSFAFSGFFGNIFDLPANNATIDSIVNGSNANIRIYGPGGVGTSYSSWKRDQTNRTIAAQTLTVDNTGTGLAFSTSYWVSYDFVAGTHTAWALYKDYLQAIGRTQMRIGALTTVAAGGSGGSGGGGGARMAIALTGKHGSVRGSSSKTLNRGCCLIVTAMAGSTSGRCAPLNLPMRSASCLRRTLCQSGFMGYMV